MKIWHYELLTHFGALGVPARHTERGFDVVQYEWKLSTGYFQLSFYGRDRNIIYIDVRDKEHRSQLVYQFYHNDSRKVRIVGDVDLVK